MKNVVYIALGSNFGNRSENLAAAIDSMLPHVYVKDCSPVYETPPWGFTSQPAFLNQVCKAETDFQPYELLAYLKKIEKELGRRATFLYGPRTIDLDILFYNDLVIKSVDVIIPQGVACLHIVRRRRARSIPGSPEPSLPGKRASVDPGRRLSRTTA